MHRCDEATVRGSLELIDDVALLLHTLLLAAGAPPAAFYAANHGGYAVRRRSLPRVLGTGALDGVVSSPFSPPPGASAW